MTEAGIAGHAFNPFGAGTDSVLSPGELIDVEFVMTFFLLVEGGRYVQCADCCAVLWVATAVALWVCRSSGSAWAQPVIDPQSTLGPFVLQAEFMPPGPTDVDDDHAP